MIVAMTSERRVCSRCISLMFRWEVWVSSIHFCCCKNEDIWPGVRKLPVFCMCWKHDSGRQVVPVRLFLSYPSYCTSYWICVSTQQDIACYEDYVAGHPENINCTWRISFPCSPGGDCYLVMHGDLLGMMGFVCIDWYYSDKLCYYDNCMCSPISYV